MGGSLECLQYLVVYINHTLAYIHSFFLVYQFIVVASPNSKHSQESWLIMISGLGPWLPLIPHLHYMENYC